MANPTWFDATKYLENKLAQLQAIDPEGKQNGDKAWDADSLTAAMEAAGFKGEEGAYQHFMTYGAAENVSPNAAFDVDFYLAAKADQLNKEQPGANWTVNKVYEAIQAAGMNVWQHYELYGSQEGVATSADFDSEKYFSEKTRLMNETKEDGRSDWSVAEVKAAFAEAGLSALEHYNIYGKAEFEAAGKTAALEAAIKANTPEAADSSFDPLTGVKTYDALTDALDAQRNGNLAEKYALNAANDAGDVTVAEQAALKDFVAGATNGTDYANATIAYHLDDTVANIANVAGSILQNSTEGYDITDSVANIAADGTSTIAKAQDVTATVSGDVSVVYTATAFANMKAIDAYDTTGLASDKVANITIDASAQTKDVTIKLSDIKAVDENVTLSATGGTGNDFLQGNDSDSTLVGGNGADWLVGGKGADVIFAGSMTSQNAGKVYAEGSDTIVAGAINADFVNVFFGPDANSNWIDPTVQTNFFKGHNIVEGREGDDILVASTGKDLFLFQTGGGGNTGKAQELTFKELGTDTIHNFTVGEDVLFIMDQSENGAGDTPTGINHKFSAGWTVEDVNKAENVTLAWNDDAHTSATVTVHGTFVTGSTEGDLVINLVGVQGADASTTVADLFGLAQATA